MNRESKPETRGRSRDRSTSVSGDVVKSQRIAKGLSQLDLANQTGLSDRLIRKAEKGEPIQFSSIQKIASCLEIPQEAILMRDKHQAQVRGMGAEMKRYLEEVWNDEKLALIDELLAPDFKFYHEQGVVHGREEMRQRILTLRKSFGDFDVTVDEVNDFGEFCVCRWRFRVTHIGQWLDLPATNRRVTVHGSSWVKVKDGLFGDAWDYWDPKLLYRELVGPETVE